MSQERLEANASEVYATEVATVMLCLCCAASSFVTGQVVAIDGGVVTSW